MKPDMKPDTKPGATLTNNLPGNLSGKFGELDARQLAIGLSRARCVIGLALIFTPKIVTTIFFGTRASQCR